jgi:hypothetical protein
MGNGAMDGLTPAERQTAMTLWAIEADPLYSGDDLTKLDAYGYSPLTNDEVIAIDQAGVAAKPVSASTDQQVWYTKDSDGSYTVALFNLGGSSATMRANWSDLGFSGASVIRDVWQHRWLGVSSDSGYSTTVASHGSVLLKVYPVGGGLFS